MDFSRLSNTELEAEIARVEIRLSLSQNTYLRKSFFARLVKLEAFRASQFDIRAPKRIMRARQM